MPEHTPATRILRDDLLAQLRAASRPMSTTELHRNAPKVPVNGLRTLVAPIREQIYRVLCALHHDGLVTRDTGQGRGVIWAPAPGAADEEIAALAEALKPACTEPAHGPSTALCIAAAHLKAAARAIGTTADSAAVTTALSEDVTSWADVLTAVSRHRGGAGHDHLIAAATLATTSTTGPPRWPGPPETDEE